MLYFICDVAVYVLCLFLMVPRVGLWFVIVEIPGLEVIKLHSQTQNSAMIGCLRIGVRKKPIIVLNFEPYSHAFCTKCYAGCEQV